MALKITKASFQQEVLDSQLPVVIDFYAEWCGPCKQMAPGYEALSAELASICKMVKVDVDHEQELAIAHHVSSIPSLVFYKDGEAIAIEVGYADKNTLREMINTHLGI